jgi:hypothetical protein
MPLVISDRAQLDFAVSARRAFAFVGRFGFHEVGSSATDVRYAKADLLANVYHGRQSYEIDFEIGRGHELYGTGELLRAANSETADQYRNYAARTPKTLVSGLDRLARVVLRDGYLALRGDEAFFDLLRKQRAASAAAFSLKVRASQLRPKAEAAFREQRYHEAAELYGQFLPCLSPAERFKLDLARRRGG